MKMEETNKAEPIEPRGKYSQVAELERILSHVSCGVAVYNVDKKGTITVEYINDEICRLVGLTTSDMDLNDRGNPMYGILKESHEGFLDAFKQIIAGEHSATSTFHSITVTGEKKWIKAQLIASEEENDILRIYGTFFDVTANIKVQKEFQEKYELEKRKSQDDATILAYAVFDLQNDTIIEIEQKKSFGKINTAQSLNGLCMEISQGIVSREKKEQFLKMFLTENLLENHKKGIDEQSIEYQRQFDDGKIVWVKSTFRIMADPSQNTILMFYYCNDINIQKSLELMSSYIVDKDYDMLGSINLMDDTAIMLYGKNSSRKINRKENLHRVERYSQSLEWFVNHAIIPEERERYHKEAYIEKIKENLRHHNSFEFVIHAKDDTRGIRTKKIRYTKNEADPNSCFFSQIDITETLVAEEEKQKLLQEALNSAKQANEAKTTFLSRMSHDMRTPMNGVLGLAELMRGETDLEKIAEDLDQLEMSGKYLLQLINDTLDVSRIESGKMELRLKPINSEMLFGNIFGNASIQAQEKGVELRVVKPEIKHGDWITVMGDASRLEQIFMNVISNAIKFTNTGGSVTIIMDTISVTADEVVDQYKICDTGIGMDDAFLEHIFEPFSQEGRTDINRENGTGLGMSIVKQLLELMNGSISISSEVGKGTEVTLVIHYPVYKGQMDDEPVEAVDLSVLENKRILLCEDHPLNARIAERLLNKKEITVIHAENGKIGVELFTDSEQGYFDVILMDIRMPEMNGLEATRAIRALNRPDATQIPIIAMTANAYEEDVKASMDAGMNAHLGKPIEPKVLYETLASYI